MIDDLLFCWGFLIFKEKLQTSNVGRVLLGSATVVCKRYQHTLISPKRPLDRVHAISGSPLLGGFAANPAAIRHVKISDRGLFHEGLINIPLTFQSIRGPRNSQFQVTLHIVYRLYDTARLVQSHKRHMTGRVALS